MILICYPFPLSECPQKLCFNKIQQSFNKIQQITSKNNDLYNQNQVLQKESEKHIKIIKDCDSKLLSRISTSIKEQNSLWLKCIAVKPGRPCDVTQGCSTSKQGLCFPINV